MQNRPSSPRNSQLLPSYSSLIVASLAALISLASFSAMATSAHVESWQGLPLYFEENRGQSDDSVDFIARGPGYMLWLADGEAWMGIPGPVESGTDESERPEMEVVRMRVVGSSESPRAVGERRLPGVANVMRGSNPSRWQLGIPLYERVRYEQILDGVDWVFYGTPEKLEHDLVVAPGVDPHALEVAFDGSHGLTLDKSGDLVVAMGSGSIRLKRPIVYQDVAGARREIPAEYVLGETQRVSFAIAEYDATLPLVIDPIIEYATFYGGSAAEIGFDIAVNRAGEAYIAGTTTSSNLPTSVGAFDEVGRVGGFFDPGDAFVAKFSRDGSSLEWATYLSGRGLDQLFGIALDDAGDVYVVGDTDSTDDLATAGVDEAYPLVNALQSTFGGGTDLVVTKLAADGASLLFSTYLGGNDVDRAENELDKPSIALDSLGRAALSVVSRSTDFHTIASCNLTSPGPYHVRLAADGSSVSACVGIGGDAFVFLRDLVVDDSDRAVTVGYTGDLNIVTTAGAYSTTRIDVEDIIISRTNSSGTTIETGTYYGGTGDDFGNGIALDNDGSIYVTGRSSSNDFPITIGGAPAGNGIVSKLDPALANVTWSRALGFFEAFAIAVDSLSRTTIVGTDNQDAAFVHLDAAGGQMFETFWGGLFPDFANGVALDRRGHAYVTGETRSSGFPGDTVQNMNPFQGSLSGNADAFVVKLLRDVPVPALSIGPLPLAGVVAILGMWCERRRRLGRGTRRFDPKRS